MRVLIITNNPNRASFRQRIGAYLDIFTAAGISAEVALLPKGFLARRRLFRRAGDFDGVFLHKKKLNRFDAQALRQHSKKIIYNFDDAIMYSDAQPGRYSRAHAVPFQRTVQLADMVVTGSAYLAARAQPFNGNVQILPLGLNVRDYGLHSRPPADGIVRLAWIGSAATLEYLNQIHPALRRVVSTHGSVVVRVIGDTFPTWKGIPTEEIKWSPEARRVNLATSDIGLAPLPDDPFTQGKCSFKVLEYSASGLPVVASPVGTNADYIHEGVTGYLAVTEDEWIERLTRLIESPELRSRMGQQGRNHAAGYDVSVIGTRFVDLVRRCLEGRP